MGSGILTFNQKTIIDNKAQQKQETTNGKWHSQSAAARITHGTTHKSAAAEGDPPSNDKEITPPSTLKCHVSKYFRHPSIEREAHFHVVIDECDHNGRMSY